MDDRENRIRTCKPASASARGLHRQIKHQESEIKHHKSQIVNPPAFTLIELLVVIVIIAVLVALLLPALNRARKQAKNLVCQTRLKHWGVTLAMYTENSEGHIPCDIGGSCSLWFLRGAFIRENEPNTAQDTLHGFRTRDIACCPLATKPARSGTGGGGSFWGSEGVTIEFSMGEIFRAWEITSPAPPFHGSYGLNGWLFHWFSERVPMGGSFGLPAKLNIFSLKESSAIPVLLDSTLMWERPRAVNPPMRIELPIGGNGIRSYCINRHDGYVNGLFLDWSVRKVGLKELWTLRWSHDFDRAGRWTRGGNVKPEDWPEWMRNFRDY